MSLPFTSYETAPNPVAPKTTGSFQQRLRELVAEVQAHGFARGRIARKLRRLAETLERT